MKKQILQQQHDMYIMIAMAIAMALTGIVLYIYFYKKSEFIQFLQNVWEATLFGLSLTFTVLFDKMFPYRHYYERRNRATIIKSSIVDTGLIHKRSVPKDKRTAGRKQVSVGKNKGTNKKRLNQM